MKKTIVTITGIRPDFIRIHTLIKKLDVGFNHILIHTGQHYDKMLSDVFFTDLGIRPPDYNLHVGGPDKEHFHVMAEISVKIIELFRKENIKPDLILFIGDSNSSSCAMALKKEGYTIGHIEAGMRSHDRRMLEEINRTVCDHCSDIFFVYHINYKNNLLKEGIPDHKIHVVGNTITEIATPIGKKLSQKPKINDKIILDIHRPENFKYKDRLKNIIKLSLECGKKYKVPIKMLYFPRTMKIINEFDISLSGIESIGLMTYMEYMQATYDSCCVISDSGTGQEEPPFLNTKVLVPRDFTERPESVESNCSYMVNVNQTDFMSAFNWLDSDIKVNLDWLGDGKTSEKIYNILYEKF